MRNKKLQANAEKQKRFREKQKALGKKMVRGYISPEAMENYKEIVEKTNWTDSDILSNSIRITYAAYRNGQIRFLNKWLQEDDRKKKLKKEKQLKQKSGNKDDASTHNESQSKHNEPSLKKQEQNEKASHATQDFLNSLDDKA